MHEPSPAAGPALLLRVADVAALLAVSPRKVQQLVASGDLPGPVALGRIRRWRRADVEAAVAALYLAHTAPDRARGLADRRRVPAAAVSLTLAE